MKRNIGVVLFALFLMAGCAHRAEIYSLPYDQTYLITMEALDDLEDWHLLETDKNQGLIKIEKSPFLLPGGTATFRVIRLDEFRTKVELIDTRWPWHKRFFHVIDQRVRTRAVTYPS